MMQVQSNHFTPETRRLNLPRDWRSVDGAGRGRPVRDTGGTDRDLRDEWSGVACGSGDVGSYGDCTLGIQR